MWVWIGAEGAEDEVGWHDMFWAWEGAWSGDRLLVCAVTKILERRAGVVQDLCWKDAVCDAAVSIRRDCECRVG
jgi:hypothetical protein